ncbi:MAG: RidA family protein [Bacillota bacterium]|nr:RidA family protein [Bacillota bacterium]
MSNHLKKSNPCTIHPPGPYTHVVRYNNMIFLSGQVGFKPDGSIDKDAESQAMQVFRNIEACLASEGATLDDLIKLTIIAVGSESKAGAAKARDHFLKDRYPACTFIVVPELYLPEYLVEVEAIAALP